MATATVLILLPKSLERNVVRYYRRLSEGFIFATKKVGKRVGVCQFFYFKPKKSRSFVPLYDVFAYNWTFLGAKSKT